MSHFTFYATTLKLNNIANNIDLYNLLLLCVVYACIILENYIIYLQCSSNISEHLKY